MTPSLYVAVKWPMYWILAIAFNLWILFMGGAGRIENTFAGYLEYGVAGEKSVYIKLVAWVSLGFSIYGFFKYVL
jgi:hypothetical protein